MVIEVTTEKRPRRAPRVKGMAARLRTRSRRGGSNGAGRKRRVIIFAALALVLLTVSAFAFIAYLYQHYSQIVNERLASGYLTSRAGIYAAPRVLRRGQGFTRERLVEILRRSGYVDSEASNVWSGRFNVDGGAIAIRPRRAERDAYAPAYDEVRIEFDGRGRIASIKGDGGELDAYALEPESLTNDPAMKTAERATLAYQDIPPVLTRAVLAIEDRRFFEHHGVDIYAVTRALLSWGKTGGGDEQDFKQGGSTITQQLVKNTYLTPERTLRRKFNEAILSSVIENRLSKEDIFALYCNEIYLGQRGSVAVRGVAQAARVFFDKDLKDLTLAEAATIAGMIQSPARYAPDRHPERAKLRRDTVLLAMLREGFINEAEARAAVSAPIEVVPLKAASAAAPYFIDYVNRAVESGVEADGERAGERVDERNLRVYTTIDTELQQLAEAAAGKQLERLGKVFKKGRQPQIALVALDPRSGHILAMVGGGSYAASQLNRATDARRQPGSVYKPFVYAAAIESGISPISTYLDAPRTFNYGYRADYRPANYGGGYSMHDVTMRQALIRSLNVVTVDVALRTGLERVGALAERLGLPRPAPYPSLALGASEATPLEIAAAYTAFANGGRFVRPQAIIARLGDGSHISPDALPVSFAEQAIRPSTSYMMTDMLTGVIREGTARAARGAVKGTALAGKTGTSRDGWFAGYTPNLVCVVWVGFDDGQPLGLTGAESALPAWLEFVKGAVELRPELGGEYFARPEGIEMIEIDPETGARASAACPRRERIALTPALAPESECFLHTSMFVADASDGEAVNDEAAPAAVSTSVRPVLNLNTSTPALPTRQTHTEPTSSGRPRLTTEMRVASEPATGWHR